jgi:hypothetical protein
MSDILERYAEEIGDREDIHNAIVFLLACHVKKPWYRRRVPKLIHSSASRTIQNVGYGKFLPDIDKGHYLKVALEIVKLERKRREMIIETIDSNYNTLYNLYS